MLCIVVLLVCSSFSFFFFCSSRRRHTRCYRDWSSDVCFPICGSAGLQCPHGDEAAARDRDRESSLLERPPAKRRRQRADLRTEAATRCALLEMRVETSRSEERRVGKECGSRRAAYREQREWRI